MLQNLLQMQLKLHQNEQLKKTPAETTVDLIGNKIANKITKNSSQTEEKSSEIPRDTHL